MRSLNPVACRIMRLCSTAFHTALVRPLFESPALRQKTIWCNIHTRMHTTGVSTDGSPNSVVLKWGCVYSRVYVKALQGVR